MFKLPTDMENTAKALLSILLTIPVFLPLYLPQDLWVCSQKISEWDWKYVPSVCRARSRTTSKRNRQLCLKGHDRLKQKVKRDFGLVINFSNECEFGSLKKKDLYYSFNSQKQETDSTPSSTCSCWFTLQRNLRFCTDCTAGCCHQRDPRLSPVHLGSRNNFECFIIQCM